MFLVKGSRSISFVSPLSLSFRAAILPEPSESGENLAASPVPFRSGERWITVLNPLAEISTSCWFHSGAAWNPGKRI